MFWRVFCVLLGCPQLGYGGIVFARALSDSNTLSVFEVVPHVYTVCSTFYSEILEGSDALIRLRK